MAFDACENYGIIAAKLPAVVLSSDAQAGARQPIVRVLDASDEIVSAGRMHGGRFTPTVYAPGEYTVEVLSPADDSTVMKRFTGVAPASEGELRVK